MGYVSALRRQTCLVVNIQLRRSSGSGSSRKKSHIGILRVLELVHGLWFISPRICVGFLLDSGQYLHFPSPLEFEWESSVCVVLVSMASFSDVHKRQEIVTFSLFSIFM